MYAHQVIESLKKERENINYDYRRINNVIRDIRNAQHFHFNTVENIIELLNVKPGCSLFSGEFGEYITPPYELCWFDFSFEKKERASKNGYLVKQVHPNWVITLYFEYNLAFDKWVAFPYSFMIGLGTSTWELHSDDLEKITQIKDIKCRVSDNVLVTDHYRMHLKNMSNEEIYELGKSSASINAYLNFSLMLINCKNVNTVTIERSSKLNKKRSNKSKQSLFNYHTLELQFPKENSISLQSIGGTSSDTILHFCRGHFKTYTSANPLFGKHIGRFWWTPQIKGNKGKGILVKDYSINKN
ncbi:hypothetical protein [Desulfopila inferna]|uniref:hypothetical protein n=1 Tax=Desulfopila inferna TaxID=468528 RepID=UPI0019647AD6|nr:hypothetical protein [Desulfopila inferna]MBM9605935.1 hypothetical protein [Desulfopila inferna]